MTTQDSQKQFATAIGWLLRLGVLISSLIVFSGAALHLYAAWAVAGQYETFQGEPKRLTTLAGVLDGAMRLRPEAIVQLGLIALIATPVARVIFCVVEFLREKDWIYSAITLVVLSLLTFSIFFVR